MRAGTAAHARIGEAAGVRLAPLWCSSFDSHGLHRSNTGSHVAHHRVRPIVSSWQGSHQASDDACPKV